MNKIIKTIYLSGWGLVSGILFAVALIMTVLLVIMKLVFLIFPLVIITVTIFFIYRHSKNIIERYFGSSRKKNPNAIEAKFKVK